MGGSPNPLWWIWKNVGYKKLIIILLCSLSAGVMPAPSTENQKPLLFSALQTVQDEKDLRAITGVATNQSETVLKDVVVKFNLYDEQGNQVGHTIAQTMDLAPGQKWNFKAPVAIRGMTSFVVSNVNVH